MGENKMKCLNCGNTEMFSVSMSQSFYCFECGGGCTKPSDDIRSFACAKCGHIELFASEEMIESYKKRKRKEEIAEIRREQMEREQKSISVVIEKLKKEILELKKFVGDENNTVKQVREGKEKIKELDCELAKLESSLKDIDYKIARIMS